MVRAGFRAALRVAEGGLGIAAPVSPRLALWRDFTAMLRDAEEQEAVCALQGPGLLGTAKLGRVLGGRLLSRAPRVAGLCYRRLGRAKPGPLLDGVADWLADALEEHV